jgi:hypothetical protein
VHLLTGPGTCQGRASGSSPRRHRCDLDDTGRDVEALPDVVPVGPPRGSIGEVAGEDRRGGALHFNTSTHHRRRRDPAHRRPAPGTEELWRADSIGAIMRVMDTEPGGERGRRYVSALSQHPDSAQAAAEVTAQVLEQLGPMPELAVLS